MNTVHRRSSFIHLLSRGAIMFIVLSTLVGASFAESEPRVPPGYILQVLEPTGGEVLRPEGWVYRGGMTSTGFDWVISKESTLEYQTGLRIQGFINVRKATGKEPREFALSQIESIKDRAKIVQLFPEIVVGYFTRVGVEVEETQNQAAGPVAFHSIYTALWNAESGIVCFTIFGAPAPEWEKCRSISETMSSIKVIDMERFHNIGRKDRRIEVYNHFSKEGANYDRAITKEYGDSYEIKALVADAKYRTPRALRGGLPREPKDEKGNAVTGRVAVAYIISNEGRVLEAKVIESNNKLLEPIVINACQNWGFAPGLIGGQPIAVAAVQIFSY